MTKRKIILTPAHAEGRTYNLYKYNIEIGDSPVHGYFSADQGEFGKGHSYLDIDLGLTNLKGGTLYLYQHFLTQPPYGEPNKKVELPEFAYPNPLEIEWVINKILKYDEQSIPLDNWDIKIGGIQLC